MADPVREPARAKTNLRLRVLGRGEDGYHDLETVFLRLGLADEVELRPGAGGSDGIELEVGAAPPAPAVGPGDDPEQGSLFPEGRGRRPGDPEGAGASGAAADAEAGAGVRPPGVDLEEVPGGPDNLCWRAAERFYAAVGEEPDLSIRLLKRIPAAGGLGGGSADAAAVLRGLARLHDDPPPPDELMRIAGELGSDVPFALLDRPMALGWERGRRLLPLEPPPARPVLLLVPDVRVATPEAFRWLDEHRGGGDGGRDGVDPPAGSAGGADGHGADRATGGGRPDPDGDEPGRPDPDGGEPAPPVAAALPPPGELACWETLLPLRRNDFETPVFARIPELGWWKEELLGEGADAAFLCGSGSTLCGLFADERRRDAAADRLREVAEVRVVTTRGPV